MPIDRRADLHQDWYSPPILLYPRQTVLWGARSKAGLYNMPESSADTLAAKYELQGQSCSGKPGVGAQRIAINVISNTEPIMSDRFRVVLAQCNFVVGDIAANAERIVNAARHARDELRGRIVVFSELSLTGYPPEDLLLRADFVARSAQAMESIVQRIDGIAAVIGHPQECGGHLYNAATVIDDRIVCGRYYKQCLPNYGVFDEKRYFEPGSEPCVVGIDGASLGVTICEDVWDDGPVEQSVAAGAELILNLNGSPYHIDKPRQREQEVIANRARANRIPIVYVNQVGGQDELVFDGASFVAEQSGQVVMRCPAFAETIDAVDFRFDAGWHPDRGTTTPPMSLEAGAYGAIVLGVRDYVNKNGFAGVVLGLSGGIDSALTLAIAVDAIGAERVEVAIMPSRFTREISITDARQQAETLGVSYEIISIEPLFDAFLAQLAPVLAGYDADTTEENIQARCRGVLLMAISNKKRKMVLTTGNKSEMAVGYATLYGDMAGGFAAIKDVPKTLVYRLAHYRNGLGVVIPKRVIERAPSAELAADQRDADSLPEYDVLDPILQAYIEDDLAPAEIVKRGFDAQTVARVVALVDRNEYKRRQAAPGVRITPRAFGRDRRFPITSGFRP